MDIDTLSRLFGYSAGHIYKFVGSVPEGQDPYEYITNLFVGELGDNSVATNVTEFKGATYFYSPLPATVEDFSFVSEVVIPQPPVEEQPAEEEEQQQSEGGV